LSHAGDIALETAGYWERAMEALAAARELLVGAHFDACASRAYYAAFYAAKAMLVHRGISHVKHAGVIAAIHRDFVRTGLLHVDAGKAISRLFEIRGVADYGDMQRVEEQGAKEAVQLAGAFTHAVQTRLEHDGLAVG